MHEFTLTENAFSKRRIGRLFLSLFKFCDTHGIAALVRNCHNAFPSLAIMSVYIYVKTANVLCGKVKQLLFFLLPKLFRSVCHQVSNKTNR